MARSRPVGLGERQVGLDLVAVAAAVLVLDDVPGLGEIGDDAVSGALGAARPGRDVGQLHTRPRAMHGSTGRGRSGSSSPPRPHTIVDQFQKSIASF